MGIGLPGFLKKKPKVQSHNTYGLTALGKTKAEEFSLHGPKWEVLACLDENGPSSVTEIAEEVKSSPEKVKMILKGLIRSGYIRTVSQEE